MTDSGERTEPNGQVPVVNGGIPEHVSLKSANGATLGENPQYEAQQEFYQEDDEEEEGFFEGLLNELGPMKSAAVVAVVLVCFVVVWPKIILPLILMLMGIRHEPQQHQSADEIASAFLGRGGHGGGHAVHDILGARFGAGGGGGIPPMPGMGGGPPPGAGGGGPMPGMMHPGFGAPHPGVRMAQQMAAAHSTQTGGRRGFTSFLLPFYSVGVIVFLLYMLGKIFFKTPQPPSQAGESPSNRSRYGNGSVHNSRDQPGYRLRYNPDSENFEVEQQGVGGRIDEDLVPGQPFSRTQLSSLQRRLTDTETALHRILQQLSTLPDGGQLDPESMAVVRQFTGYRQTEDPNTQGNYGTSTTPTQSAETGEDRESAESSGSEGDRSDQDLEQMDEDDKGPQGYLADLEKALMDFERFTSEYVAKHQAEQGGVPAQSNNNPPQDAASMPCDDQVAGSRDQSMASRDQVVTSSMSDNAISARAEAGCEVRQRIFERSKSAEGTEV